MEPIAAQLDQIATIIRDNLQQKYIARDKALQCSRDTIRHSANAIRAVHRGELEAARKLLAQARSLLQEVGVVLADHPDVYYAGFVHDAQKEYAEGSITLAVVEGVALPTPESLAVGYAAYLNGAGEAVGELRRQVLDRLRLGEAARCEELLSAMDEIYAVLVAIDFPDAMTGGLRRTTDSTRGILERTRGDLTMALVQRTVQQQLEDLRDQL